MNRRSLLSSLLLAPFARFLPKPAIVVDKHLQVDFDIRKLDGLAFHKDAFSLVSRYDVLMGFGYLNRENAAILLSDPSKPIQYTKDFRWQRRDWLEKYPPSRLPS